MPQYIRSRVQNLKRQIASEVRQTPSEYWPNLLLLVRLFRESITMRPASECFCRGWEEAMTGQISPLCDLWEDIDAE